VHFALFWRWGLANCLQTLILLISTSQVAMITGGSHWHLAGHSYIVHVFCVYAYVYISVVYTPRNEVAGVISSVWWLEEEI
jgi:hypothetical protein